MTLKDIKAKYKEFREEEKSLDSFNKEVENQKKELELLKDKLTYNEFYERAICLKTKDKWTISDRFDSVLRNNIKLFAEYANVRTSCDYCSEQYTIDIYIKNQRIYTKQEIINFWLEQLKKEYEKEQTNE